MKDFFDMKVGDIFDEDMMDGVLKAPIKLVKITYTFEDKNETCMDFSIIHKNFKEKDED